MAVDIKTLEVTELEKIFQDLGEPKYRAKQLFEWLHNRNASSYEEMTNLPKALREKLSLDYPLSGISLFDKRVSEDGSRKYVFKLDDGTLVETVGIISSREAGIDDDNEFNSKNRLTVCFSTQAGCQMKCAFCATGKGGFTRNLSSSEMVDQITAVRDDFAKDHDDVRVANVVAMGQGEPFLNYEELIKALHRINTDSVLEIGARRITVSSCGILNGIERFSEEPEQYRLAISLHSADQDTRDELMPALSGQPLSELKKVLQGYNQRKNRRITLEYLMIDGVNDEEEDFKKLIDFCDGLMCHVNLIPFNTVDGFDFHSSSERHIKYWEGRLNECGVPVSIRYSKGSDIAGACGQLVNKISER